MSFLARACKKSRLSLRRISRSVTPVMLCFVLLSTLLPVQAVADLRAMLVAATEEPGTTHPVDEGGASTTRIYGAGRTGTAIAASKKGWTRSSTIVVSDVRYAADQCVAAPLAGVYSAPLLLSDGGRFTSATVREIKRLKATRAFLVTSNRTVASRASAGLKKAGIRTTVKLVGANAADTSARVAKQMKAKTRKVKAAILVNSTSPLDALGGLPMAGRLGLPVLFVSKGSVPSPTTAFLKSGLPLELIVAGPASRISTPTAFKAASSAKVTGERLSRISGADSYETASKFAEFAFGQGLSFATTFIASQDKPADLYTAATLAARRNGTIAVTRRYYMPFATDDFIRKHGSSINAFYLFGDVNTTAKEHAAELADATKTLFQPNAEVVNASLGSMVTSVAADSTKVYFSAGANLSSVQAGDVLVSGRVEGAPQGFLVEVAQAPVADGTGGIVLQTKPATMAQVIKQGSIDLNVASSGNKVTTSGVRTAGTYTLGTLQVDLAKKLVDEKNVKVGTEGTLFLQARCVASFSFGATRWIEIEEENWLFSWHTRIPVAWGVTSFEFTPQIIERLNLALVWEGSWKGTKTIDIGSKIRLGSLDFLIGPVPVIITFNAQPVLELSASVSINGRVTVNQNFSAQAGYRWDRDSGGHGVSGQVPGEAAPSFTVVPTTRAKGEAKASVGVRLSMMLYDMGGMTATPRAYLRMQADTTWRPWFKVFGGVECEWGAEVDIFDIWEKRWSFGSTRFWETQIWPNGQDKRAPVTTLTVLSQPDGLDGWYVTRPKVKVSVDEDAQTFVGWPKDGKPVQSWGSIDGDTFEASDGVVQPYCSEDLSGNREAPKSIPLKVDTQKPIGVGGTSVTPRSVATSKTDVSVRFLAEEAGSGIAGWSISWSQDQVSDPGLSITGQSDTTSKVLTNGTWYANARVRDKAGNWSSLASYGPFIIDTTPPTVAKSEPGIGATDVDPELYPRVVFSEVMVGNSVPSSFILEREQSPGSWVSVPGKPIYNAQKRELLFRPAETLGEDSSYRIRVQGAQDLAGNSCTPFMGPFETGKLPTTDVRPPETSLETSPQAAPSEVTGWYTSPTTVTLWAEQGATTKYMAVPGAGDGSYRPDPADARFKSGTSFALPEGISDVYWYSTDAAGNREEVNYQRIKVDTVPLVVTGVTAHIDPRSNAWLFCDDTIGSVEAKAAWANDGSGVWTEIPVQAWVSPTDSKMALFSRPVDGQTAAWPYTGEKASIRIDAVVRDIAGNPTNKQFFFRTWISPN